MSSLIIKKLGFDFESSYDVQGRLSISDIFPKTKNRCGIYLLMFSDETFYIGQALNAVRRFAQHRKKYTNIVKFWFLPVPKTRLNQIEQNLIQEAEINGLLLTNRTYVSNIIGETDLDYIIPFEDQTSWLETDKALSNENFDLYSTIDLKHKIKYRHNFEILSQIPDYQKIKSILNAYITKCLPAYKKTEQSFWSLSCLSSTNINTYPRYFCLNVNAMEVFVLGYEKKNKTPFGFFILSTRFYKSIKTIPSYLKKYKSLEIEESSYRAAGADQMRFSFSDLTDIENILLNEKDIIESLKEVNLRLMRKGGTIYSPYHCFDLTHDVL